VSPRKAPGWASDLEPAFSHALRTGASGLSALLDTLEEDLAGRGVPPATIASVMIAADEVLSNAVNHGGEAVSVEIAVQVTGDHVALRVTDDGAAFDPLAAEAPDTTLSLEDRTVGGLGVHLVRKLMDHVGYERCGKHNRLQFSKSFASTSTSRQSAGEAS